MPSSNQPLIGSVTNSAPQKAVSTALAVFCKTPKAGQVKTRLCPPLTLEQAAALYQIALDETLQRCAALACDLVICYSGEEEYFAQKYPGVQRRPQRGENLGARLGEALQGLLEQGYTKVVLMGSDSPDLPLDLVERAFATLDAVEVVIAPAADGGYVLLGARNYYAALFDAMPWSSPLLMPQTRAMLRAHGISWEQLRQWQDMDDEDALRALLKRSPASRTARYIQEFGLIRP